MQNSIKTQTFSLSINKLKPSLYSHASNYTKMNRDKYFNINYEIITFNIIFLKFFQRVFGLWVLKRGFYYFGMVNFSRCYLMLHMYVKVKMLRRLKILPGNSYQHLKFLFSQY